MKKNLKKQITNVPIVGLNGNWSFHPKPQSHPISVRKALKNLSNESRCETRYLSEDLQKVCQEFYKLNINQNHNTPLIKKLLQKYTGSTGSYIGFKPLYWHKPCSTISKNTISRTGLIHPSGKRYLLIEEIQKLSSFPDDYLFTGTYKEQHARMGNCVPPNLMKAIALNLKQSPFLKNIKNPTVVGTFTGCGGSSLGFHLAGFKELLAIEYDDNAVETFKLNFPDVKVFHGDIATLSVEKTLVITSLKPGELDCLQGSPPCQGFSTLGKRKLNDSRNSLFKEYARLLEGLQPKCFVMENVTGMIKGHMKSTYLEAINALRKCGYKAKGQVLNAKYYNVPQSRERVFIIGVRNDLA